jgi:hypothetical protein
MGTSQRGSVVSGCRMCVKDASRSEKVKEKVASEKGWVVV